jgi:hypothetical protein
VNEHRNPLWSRLIQQGSGVKTRQVAPLLEPSIQPIIIVDDLRVSGSGRRIGWAATALDNAGTATNYPYLAVWNPVGSGVVAHVTRARVADRSGLTGHSALVSLQLSLNVTYPGGGFNVYQTDSRNNLVSGTLQARATNDISFTPLGSPRHLEFATFTNGVNDAFFPDLDVVIGEGHAVTLIAGWLVAGQALSFSLGGYYETPAQT